MIKEFKTGFLIALSFLLTLGLVGMTYAAILNINSVSTSDTLTADLMNNVINNQKDLDTRIGLVYIPSGAVMAFNLSTCPTGWSEANGTDNSLDLRGTFIRGINGDANSRDVSRVLGNYQADSYMSHLHNIDPPSTATNTTGAHTHTYTFTGEGLGTTAGAVNGTPEYAHTTNTSSAGNHAHTVNIAAFNSANTGGTETRPKNVALLYCVKD